MLYGFSEQPQQIEAVPGVNGNLGVLLRPFIHHELVVAVSAVNITIKISLKTKEIITVACIYRSLRIPGRDFFAIDSIINLVYQVIAIPHV